MRCHQCIQSNAHTQPSVARGPLLLTSRLAPTLHRSGLRRPFGAKAFASGRDSSKRIIRAAAEPEGSTNIHPNACCKVNDLDAYGGMPQAHTPYNIKRCTEKNIFRSVQFKILRQRQKGLLFRMWTLKGSGFPCASLKKYQRVRCIVETHTHYLAAHVLTIVCAQTELCIQSSWAVCLMMLPLLSKEEESLRPPCVC